MSIYAKTMSIYAKTDTIAKKHGWKMTQGTTVVKDTKEAIPIDDMVAILQQEGIPAFVIAQGKTPIIDKQDQMIWIMAELM